MAVAATRGRVGSRIARRRTRGAGDDELVARFRGGDDDAFEAIYERYHGSLLAFCRHLLGSLPDAEDALQHCFAAAYRTLPTGTGDMALKPWLFTVARNRCLSLLRAPRERVADDGLELEPPSFDGLADEVERRADLRDLLFDLQLLAEDQRAALVLFELGGYRQEEIATVLGVRRDKVKALVFQAREGMLRARAARDTPCREIRAELAMLAGRTPHRGLLRAHLDRCPSCAGFHAGVRRQRAALALILPVVPSAGLKGSVLLATIGGGTAAAGAGLAGGAAGCAITGGTAGGGLAGATGVATSAGGAAVATAGAGTAACGAAAGGTAAVGVSSGVAGGIAAGGMAIGGASGVAAKALSVVALVVGGSSAAAPLGASTHGQASSPTQPFAARMAQRPQAHPALVHARHKHAGRKAGLVVAVRARPKSCAAAAGGAAAAAGGAGASVGAPHPAPSAGAPPAVAAAAPASAPKQLGPKVAAHHAPAAGRAPTSAAGKACAPHGGATVRKRAVAKSPRHSSTVRDVKRRRRAATVRHKTHRRATGRRHAAAAPPLSTTPVKPATATPDPPSVPAPAQSGAGSSPSAHTTSGGSTAPGAPQTTVPPSSSPDPVPAASASSSPDPAPGPPSESASAPASHDPESAPAASEAPPAHAATAPTSTAADAGPGDGSTTP